MKHQDATERAAKLADRAARGLERVMWVAQAAGEWSDYRKFRKLYLNRWDFIFRQALAKYQK